ncbi:MAG: T9SS type A sorting domain-containing protein [Flavobacteriales bacterium]|nr:T9SS type A sorting domain-containing protein [Flavobacteriales bacterium]
MRSRTTDPGSHPDYPNPGTDNFTIELPSRDQQATVILLDATGREVWREVLRKEANNVHTSSLELGLYNYRICAKDGGLLGHGRWIKE